MCEGDLERKGGTHISHTHTTHISSQKPLMVPDKRISKTIIARRSIMDNEVTAGSLAKFSAILNERVKNEGFFFPFHLATILTTTNRRVHLYLSENGDSTPKGRGRAIQ